MGQWGVLLLFGVCGDEIGFEGEFVSWNEWDKAGVGGLYRNCIDVVGMEWSVTIYFLV